MISPSISDPPGCWRYERELPPDADFIFVDGPYHPHTDCGIDVPLLLKRGHRPKVISVDGRLTCVDAIRATEAAADYHWYRQFRYAFENRQLISSFALRGQSFFIRKT